MSLSTAEQLLNIVIIANGAAVISGIAISMIFRRRLRSLYPAQWEALGSPGVMNNSIGNAIRYQKYIFGSAHRELNDETINRLALAQKVIIISVIGFLVTASVLIFAYQAQHGLPPPVSKPTHNHPLNRYGAALLGIFATGIAVSTWLPRYLHQSHPGKWMQLGSPSVFMNNSIANRWKMLRFIWSSEHKKLGDPVLTTAIYAIRLFSILILVAFFLLGPLATK